MDKTNTPRFNKDSACVNDGCRNTGIGLVFYSAYSKALRDADRILITLEDPSNAKALLIKGDAQYNLGDFEHSLISYYRALKHSTTKVCVYFEKHYTHGHLVC